MLLPEQIVKYREPDGPRQGRKPKNWAAAVECATLMWDIVGIDDPDPTCGWSKKQMAERLQIDVARVDLGLQALVKAGFVRRCLKDPSRPGGAWKTQLLVRPGLRDRFKASDTVSDTVSDTIENQEGSPQKIRRGVPESSGVDGSMNQEGSPQKLGTNNRTVTGPDQDQKQDDNKTLRLSSSALGPCDQDLLWRARAIIDNALDEAASAIDYRGMAAVRRVAALDPERMLALGQETVLGLMAEEPGVVERVVLDLAFGVVDGEVDPSAMNALFADGGRVYELALPWVAETIIDEDLAGADFDVDGPAARVFLRWRDAMQDGDEHERWHSARDSRSAPYAILERLLGAVEDGEVDKADVAAMFTDGGWRIPQLVELAHSIEQRLLKRRADALGEHERRAGQAEGRAEVLQ